MAAKSEPDPPLPPPPPSDADASAWLGYWVEIRLRSVASLEGALRRHAMREIKRLSKRIGAAG